RGADVRVQPRVFARAECGGTLKDRGVEIAWSERSDQRGFEGAESALVLDDRAGSEDLHDARAVGVGAGGGAEWDEVENGNDDRKRGKKGEEEPQVREPRCGGLKCDPEKNGRGAEIGERAGKDHQNVLPGRLVNMRGDGGDAAAEDLLGELQLPFAVAARPAKGADGKRQQPHAEGGADDCVPRFMDKPRNGKCERDGEEHKSGARPRETVTGGPLMPGVLQDEGGGDKEKRDDRAGAAPGAVAGDVRE